MGKAEGQVCSQEVGSREDEGPSNDERCGQEEAVRLDESPLGCEEEACLARFPSANIGTHAKGLETSLGVRRSRGH